MEEGGVVSSGRLSLATDLDEARGREVSAPERSLQREHEVLTPRGGDPDRADGQLGLHAHGQGILWTELDLRLFQCVNKRAPLRVVQRA